MKTTKFFYRDPDAPRPNQPIGVGVLALIENGNKLLLERRSDCGRWSLVGGAVEVEESLDSVLRREVLEETGLSIKTYELFCISSDPTRIIEYPDGNVIRLLSFVYEVEIENFDSIRSSEESQELRFFEEVELSELDIVETARPIVSEYLSDGSPRPFLL